jgi:glycosyltransferase involved in cell wall biosynthesis
MSSKPLKVAYTIQNVGNIDFGHDVGDTVPVKRTLLGLQEAGHRVTCFMLNGRAVRALDDVAASEHYREVGQGLSGTRPFRLFESGLRRAQRELRLPYLALFDSLRFYEAALRFLPGYALCHEHSGLLSAGTALACRRTATPYVLTVSADPFVERASMGRSMPPLQRRLAAAIARFTYRQAARIFCVSEPAKQNLVQRWQVQPRKIVVLPNGVDAQRFRPDLDGARVRQALGLNGEPLVTFSGSFQPWHGLEELISSFAHIRAELPQARLLLVGDGRHRPAVEQAIREHGVQDGVTITGLVPQEQVAQLLALSDVAVVPYPQLPQELWFSPLKLYDIWLRGGPSWPRAQDKLAR